MKAQVKAYSNKSKSVQEIMMDAKKNSQTVTENVSNNNYTSQQNYNPIQQNYNPLGMQNTHVPDETFQDLFFKSEGRLNRLRFFKRTMLATLLAIIPALLVIMSSDNPSYYDETSGKFIALMILGNVISVCLMYNLIIRRCHDLSKESWWAKQIKENDRFIANVYVGFAVISVCLI